MAGNFLPSTCRRTAPDVWDLAVLPGGPNPLGEGVPVVTNIVPSNLREGDNVIAVELHQHLFTTGDDLFGMKLTATLPQRAVNWRPMNPAIASCWPS